MGHVAEIWPLSLARNFPQAPQAPQALHVVMIQGKIPEVLT